jgi:hypothetical protein
MSIEDVTIKQRLLEFWAEKGGIILQPHAKDFYDMISHGSPGFSSMNVSRILRDHECGSWTAINPDTDRPCTVREMDPGVLENVLREKVIREERVRLEKERMENRRRRPLTEITAAERDVLSRTQIGPRSWCPTDEMGPLDGEIIEISGHRYCLVTCNDD